MADFLKREKRDGIVLLTMNRPEQRNALSDVSDCEEFVEACHEIDRDKTVNVAILTGNGPAFSAGGDVKKMRDRSGFAPAKTVIDTLDSYKHSIQRIPKALYDIEIPTIAAVNGPAIGAGLDLACMCDMRIASDKAIFAESFIKLGIVPGDGGAWFLPRLVGYAKACEMAFTGDRLDAQQALDCGLVSRVVPGPDLMMEAFELAERIDAQPGRTTRLTKRLLRESANASLDLHLALSAAFQTIVHETEDHREALDAFFEKRKPGFVNR